jgi:hypothetical protein
MAKWFDFPFEIRCNILFWFCKDIIQNFTAPINDSFNFERDEFNPEQRIPISIPKWPPGPVSLRSFSSALQTCNDFYDIICDCIRFEGKSTSEVLEEAQYHILRALMDTRMIFLQEHPAQPTPDMINICELFPK